MIPPPKPKTKPDWDNDGNPINLQAAALDAAEWVELFARIFEKSKSPLADSAVVKMKAASFYVRRFLK